MSAGRLTCERATLARSGAEVVRQATLSLLLNESLGIIGPNGAGKSSLMLGMLGVLPPVAGRIGFDGCDLSAISPRRRADLFAYVPQVSGAMPPMRVREVVATGAYPRLGWLGRFGSPLDERIDGIIEECGLGPIADRDIRGVSAGERQKTLIASAIAQDAQCMFLDEPDGALDPGYEVELARLLHAWRSRGRGLVIISHDLGFAGAVCQRIVAMRTGSIAADGPADEILSPARLSELFGSTFEFATTASGRRVVVSAWS